MSTWTSISNHLDKGKRSGRAALRKKQFREKQIERYRRAKAKYSGKKRRDSD